MSALYRLHLAKEDFKFSSAHFTVFAPGVGEHMHGHNYHVRLDLEGSRLDELGLLCDLQEVKAAVRALCHELDSRTLVPADCELVEVRSEEGQVEVRFDGRTYRLPAADVVVLPLANTSIELLARFFWLRLAAGLRNCGVERLSVEVGETRGQSASYCANLDSAPDASSGRGSR